MKVVHLNSLTYGGAGVVAKRIHKALLEKIVDSLLVTKYGLKSDIERHIFYKSGAIRNFLRSGSLGSFLFPAAKSIAQLLPHPNLAGRSKEFEIFSPLAGSIDTTKMNALENSDIIHLHWVSDFIDYNTFFKTFANKKFIWTIHDMNPFTGGCHHSDGCFKFETNCELCPQLKNTKDENYSHQVQAAKWKGLAAIKDDQLVIVSPSHWLYELSRKSKILGRFRHVVIPNPSFKTMITPESRSLARKELGLPSNKKIILFASDNLNNKRKGISYLFQSIRELPINNEIILIGVGSKASQQKGLNIIYTGIISSIKDMTNYFLAADIFVTPTVAENSPLVVIESLCCGTPVVSSNVGGIPDLIDAENGILFPVGNINELRSAILQALMEKKFDHKKIMTKAIAIHDPLSVADQYLKLYKTLLV